MTTAPVDPRFAMEAANTQDLVQKKLSIDAMRKRVSGGPSEEAKLRDACEGFESIFLQKMWEQMRKNVKKEGYLHSKDEEAYQSMFDTELAKKMASAGGIGLGDMLYEQLSQKLTHTSRATGLGPMRDPLPIEPAGPLKPEPAADAGAPEELYTEVESAARSTPAEQKINYIQEALEEFAAGRDPSLDPANATYPMFDMRSGAPQNPVAGRMKEETGGQREVSVNPLPERVSAPGKGKPSASLRNIGRSARHSKKNAQPPNVQTVQAAPVQTPAQGPSAAQPQGVGPEQAPAAVLPVPGEVVSSYGRQIADDGTVTWNTGMRIEAAVDAPVTAPLDGVVAFAGEKDGVEQVVLRHADGLTSRYTNVRSNLAEGDPVAAGTEFARIAAGVGASNAGPAEEPGRIGFEIRRGELALNPERLLA